MEKGGRIWQQSLLCSYVCIETDRGGCQVTKCPWVSELGQRSTGCKITQNRYTVISMSSSDLIIPIQFTETIQNILKKHVALSNNLDKN